MTDTTPETRPVCEMPTIKAALAACNECPWRLSNAGRKHSTDQYGESNITSTWRGIAKDGRFLGCHIFDGDIHLVPEEDLQAGYKPTVDIGARKECAGSVAMMQREFELMVTYPTYDEYIKARPAGLSKNVIQRLMARLAGRAEPELRFNPHQDYTDILDPAELIDTSSLEWTLSHEGAVGLLLTVEALIGSSCDCRVCENHESVHRPKKLKTITGDVVNVDQELHGLLDEMVRAGIRTMSSCINIADALDKLWPERKPQLVRIPVGELHYRDMILREAAHVRINNTTAQAKAFTVAAAQTPGVIVTTTGIVTQFVFPQAAIPRLMKIAGVLRTVANPAPRRPTDHKPKSRKGKK